MTEIHVIPKSEKIKKEELKDIANYISLFRSAEIKDLFEERTVVNYKEKPEYPALLPVATTISYLAPPGEVIVHREEVPWPGSDFAEKTVPLSNNPIMKKLVEMSGKKEEELKPEELRSLFNMPNIIEAARKVKEEKGVEEAARALSELLGLHPEVAKLMVMVEPIKGVEKLGNPSELVSEAYDKSLEYERSEDPELAKKGRLLGLVAALLDKRLEEVREGFPEPDFEYYKDKEIQEKVIEGVPVKVVKKVGKKIKETYWKAEEVAEILKAMLSAFPDSNVEMDPEEAEKIIRKHMKFKKGAIQPELSTALNAALDYLLLTRAKVPVEKKEKVWKGIALKVPQDKNWEEYAKEIVRMLKERGLHRHVEIVVHENR